MAIMNMLDKFKLYQTKAFERKADMIWTLILSGLLINLVGVLTMPQTAPAAVPPLSTEELEESASHIVVGKVKSISSHEVKVPSGSDYQLTAVIELKSLERWALPPGSARPAGYSGLPSIAPKPGENIEVYYRRVRKRPPGWTGSIGQNYRLRLDTQVKLFLILDEKGHLQLLEPNGWEAIPSR